MLDQYAAENEMLRRKVSTLDNVCDRYSSQMQVMIRALHEQVSATNEFSKCANLSEDSASEGQWD